MSTDADLLDWVVPSQQITYRFDLVDATLAVLGTVKPVKECTVVNDSRRNIMRTLESFRLDPSTQPDINTFSDRVRPVMVLENGSEYNLGAFVFTDESKKLSTMGYESDCTLADFGVLVDQPRGVVLSFPSGYLIKTALEAMADSSGVVYQFTQPLTQVLGAPIYWPSGTSPWRAMKDLCLLAEFLPPFFDNDGVLTFTPVPAFLTPSVEYEIGTRIVRDSILESDDRISAPNRYVAVSSSVTGSPVVGTFTIPSAAPNSYENIGYYRKEVIQAQGLTTVGQCQQVARRAYLSDRQGYRHISFRSPVDPRHDTFTSVGFLGVTCRELSWRATLGGLMEHTLIEVYQ